MNNPEPERHGLDLQSWSVDDGLTWSAGTTLAYPPRPNVGAMIGPSVGMRPSQTRTPRLYEKSCGSQARYAYLPTHPNDASAALQRGPIRPLTSHGVAT